MIRTQVVARAALALAFAAGAAHADTVVLTDATVHTVSGATLEHASIAITDGRIAAVGTDLTPVPNARTIALAGKHVYPGFVSANTVLGLVEIGSVQGSSDYEETGSTNPNIRAEVGINPESDLIPVARVNGVTSALVVPHGQAIAGTSGLIHLDGWNWDDMTVKAPVGLHVSWPNMTPVRGGFRELRSPDEQTKARDQAIDNIRKAFDDARAYWTARDAEHDKGIPRHDRDVKWDAMGKALRGEIPVFFQASALNQIRAVLRFCDDEGLKNVVLVGGDDAWRVADEIKRRNIAVIAGPTLALPRHASDSYDAAFAGPARLQAAGIRFCISDGGGPFTAMNARNLPYHAAMAASFGLPKDEALKAITLYPAQILGVGDKLGSIEPGKIADLVVTDGDPLEITTHVEQVWIAGRQQSMENRQTRLFQKYDNKPKGPLARRHDGAATAGSATGALQK
ncbi:MAG TPA: amidohydrolase family protein [Candidatus Eisenbacteria bacterium]|nr:amidohydrolase family protein [Candidatus Eisenbacteria bacterium]